MKALCWIQNKINEGIQDKIGAREGLLGYRCGVKLVKEKDKKS